MRIPLRLLALFFLLSSLYWADPVIAGAVVGNQSSPSRPADAGRSAGQTGIVEKLSLRDDKSSADTTWSQGLALGVNGPIPVIVVDQFGYPTKASKVAVIRDPKAGYDSAAHFTPGAIYALVDRSTGKIVKQGPPTPWNGGAGTKGYRCFFSAAFSLCSNSDAPPLGQPALKSYREFNEGWPVNSWEVTEPSTGYQAHYILVLAKYLR